MIMDEFLLDCEPLMSIIENCLFKGGVAQW